MNVRVLNYFDVWREVSPEGESWQVNDLCTAFEAECPENAIEGKKALLWLRKQGFLRSIQGLEAISYGPGRTEIERRKNGRPIGAIEEIYES